ncbi:MAG TPA: hypothetical protein VHR66_10155 [Gemmataceae bacterium]|nr:hypothetical protein [Gemmataceae bacterium]
MDFEPALVRVHFQPCPGPHIQEFSLVLLRHGTTLKRAQAIAKDGPDAAFLEPGSSEPAEGFSTAPEGSQCRFGNPETCALGKATLFPSEGGPAILEIELSDAQFRKLVAPPGRLQKNKALHAEDEIRFERSAGLEGLLRIWPELIKTVKKL